MNTTRKKFLLLFLLVLAVLSAHFVFNGYFKDTYFYGSLKLTESVQSVTELATDLFKREGAELVPESFIVRLSADRDYIQYKIRELGIKEANRLIRDSLWAYQWQVTIKDEDNIDVVISNQSNSIIDPKKSGFSAKFTPRGELLSYGRRIPDSLYLPSVSFNEVKNIINKFVLKNRLYFENYRGRISSGDIFSDLTLADSSVIERANRTDYNIKLLSISAANNDSLVYDFAVAGNILSSFNIERVKKDYGITKGVEYYSGVVIVVLFIIIMSITILVSAIRRIKAYEIGFRFALFFGALYGILFAYSIYLETGGMTDWQIILPMALGGLFFGAIVTVAWAVSETVTRETWKEKLTSLDLIANGYLLHSKIGEAILKGSAVGLAAAALWLVIVSLFSANTSAYSYLSNQADLRIFDVSIPSVIMIANVIQSMFLLVSLFFLFIMAAVRKRINNDYLFIIISVTIWALISVGNIKPTYVGFSVNLVTGVIFVLLYYRYDFLTTFIAIFVHNLAFYSFNMISVESDYYLQLLIPVYITSGIVIIYAVYALFTKDSITDLESITPAFVKNITERQRLQRELEIARYVQMSFLPKKSPEFSGLDIASSCLPALEVGGDYFDFVPIEKKRLGVIVGDVSGKGTQAAFYMTLTKGFLKALSRSNSSTSEVLKDMNSLFYENVDRGTFISMIYAVFDMEGMTFRMSRAGHNPVIVKSSGAGDVKIINPKGLALGLEAGILFNSAIYEVEYPLAAGDSFLFYTDGFTEAMNKKGEEYGEQRLTSVFSENSGRTAAEIMEAIIKDVKSFMGKEKQHDDMTMVIVRVL